jgi:hypothetical protein
MFLTRAEAEIPRDSKGDYYLCGVVPAAACNPLPTRGVNREKDTETSQKVLKNTKLRKKAFYTKGMGRTCARLTERAYCTISGRFLQFAVP